MALIWLLATFLALPAGQGIAFALTGHGFVWPDAELGESVIGLLAGEPGRGLPQASGRSAPPVSLVYALVGAIDLALTACTLLGLSRWWRTVGPHAQFGMADPHEVAKVLGRTQLKKRRRTIRPDLTVGTDR